MKKTLVLGASPNPLRFSHKMVKSLVRHGYEVIPIGIREGQIAEVDIVIGKPKLENIHTVSLYLQPEKQKEYYEYLIELHPHRIIFNPGTFNQELSSLAEKNDIQTVKDCGLVMINNGFY